MENYIVRETPETRNHRNLDRCLHDFRTKPIIMWEFTSWNINVSCWVVINSEWLGINNTHLCLSWESFICKTETVQIVQMIHLNWLEPIHWKHVLDFFQSIHLHSWRFFKSACILINLNQNYAFYNFLAYFLSFWVQ